VRDESNLLMRSWQAKDRDRKHGRDRSVAVASMSDWQGCLRLTVFSKSHITYFSVFILIAVSNASSSSLHLKHGALSNRYELGD